MRRCGIPAVLAIALLAGGCRSWNVDAFGVPVGERTAYATVENTPPRTLGHHAKLSTEGLSKDEKVGVVVVVGVAIAAIVAYFIWWK